MQTLAGMLAALEEKGALRPNRVKDYKTSLRYLAAALGYPALEQCPVCEVCRDPDQWLAALHAHFETLESAQRTISGQTRSNTRNNIRVVFRAAEVHGLLQAPLPPTLLPMRGNTSAFMDAFRRATPYAHIFGKERPDGHWLHPSQMPPDIVRGFEDYKDRCGERLRATTFTTYAGSLRGYVGYIIEVEGLSAPQWADLFQVARLKAFVRWHTQRRDNHTPSHAVNVVRMIGAMANVLEHPERTAIAAYRQTLKQPAPLRRHRDHWVERQKLEEVAQACLAEGRLPVHHTRKSRHPGLDRAGVFQRGVILALLVRLPLRQRNVREMQLGRHLAQDRMTGEWHVEFRGPDLKIGNRGQDVNTYTVNLSAFAPDWVTILEEYLTLYRPKFPNAASSRFVFLTQYGKPHSSRSLHAAVSEPVALHTGQRFYPHLMRTIWATAYIEETNDYQTAATMLGDTLQVCLKTYYKAERANQQAKASAFNTRTLGK